MPFTATWRDCHIKWGKSDRGRLMSYDITYMWNVKKNDVKCKKMKWTYLQNNNRLRLTKQTHGYQRRRQCVGGDKLGVWD